MKQTFGVAWFRADQCERLLAISSDRAQLEKTFEGWRDNAEKQIAALQKQGLDVRKVDVDLDELTSWCKTKMIPINGDTRSKFAAYKLQLESKRN